MLPLTLLAFACIQLVARPVESRDLQKSDPDRSAILNSVRQRPSDRFVVKDFFKSGDYAYLCALVQDAKGHIQSTDGVPDVYQWALVRNGSRWLGYVLPEGPAESATHVNCSVHGQGNRSPALATSAEQIKAALLEQLSSSLQNGLAHGQLIETDTMVFDVLCQKDGALDLPIDGDKSDLLFRRGALLRRGVPPEGLQAESPSLERLKAARSNRSISATQWNRCATLGLLTNDDEVTQRCVDSTAIRSACRPGLTLGKDRQGVEACRSALEDFCRAALPSQGEACGVPGIRAWRKNDSRKLRPGRPPSSVVERATKPLGARAKIESAGEILVGSERGLEAWQYDGRKRRSISTVPALYPRWLDDDHLLVLNPVQKDDLSKGFSLERISTSGERSKIVDVPTFDCLDGSVSASGLDPQAQGVDSRLQIVDAEDVVYDSATNAACISLVSRSESSPLAVLNVRIDLDKKAFERWFWTERGGPSALSARSLKCLAEKNVPRASVPTEQWCPEVASQANNTLKMPFEFSRGALRRTTGEKASVLSLPGYVGGAVSPSARWQILFGDGAGSCAEGPTSVQCERFFDTWSGLLLDRQKGQVHRLKTTPSVLTPLASASGDGVINQIEVPVRDTIRSDRSDVRWLSFSSGVETLVAGQVLLTPGAPPIILGGYVAK